MRLWMWLALVVVAVPIGALADEQVIGIGGNYWSNYQTQDDDESCILAQTGAAACALLPAGDISHDGFNPLNIAVSITAGGAMGCCYVSDPDYLMARTVVDGVGDAAWGSCPYFFETTSGGRYDDRPSRRRLLAAGAAGIDAGICSVAALKTGAGAGDVLYASCAVGGAGNTLCAAYDDGVTTGTCLAWNDSSVTDAMRARVAVFGICEATTEDTTIAYTARKQDVTK